MKKTCLKASTAAWIGECARLNRRTTSCVSRRWRRSPTTSVKLLYDPNTCRSTSVTASLASYQWKHHKLCTTSDKIWIYIFPYVKHATVTKFLVLEVTWFCLNFNYLCPGETLCQEPHKDKDLSWRCRHVYRPTQAQERVGQRGTVAGLLLPTILVLGWGSPKNHTSPRV